MNKKKVYMDDEVLTHYSQLKGVVETLYCPRTSKAFALKESQELVNSKLTNHAHPVVLLTWKTRLKVVLDFHGHHKNGIAS